MKKFFSVIIALAIASTAFAEEKACCGECSQAENSTSAGFVSNSFWSNWFVGGGLGASFTVDGPFSNPNMGVGFILDLNTGKWFNPIWGIRTGVKGLGANWRQVGVDHPFNFALVHGDVLWNLTNMIKGYNPDRKFQVYPYLTAGLYWPVGLSKNFTAGLGLIGEYAFTDRLAAQVDLTGIFLKQACVGGTSSCGGITGQGLATVGVVYKLGKKTGFTTAAAIAAPLAAEVAAAKAAAAEAAQKAAEAEQKAAEAAAAGSVDGKYKAAIDEYTMVVNFKINEYKLSNREKAAIITAAPVMKAIPDVKFVITGYADSQTGVPAYNQKLSEKRAEAVKKVLVSDCGIAEEQVVIDAKGGVDDLYLNDPQCSRSAVITVVKD